jgi:hypothetical protein
MVCSMTGERRSNVRTGKPEALDIMRKWSSERTLLRCELRFMLFSFTLQGRIVSVSDNELRVVADDNLSDMMVRLYDEWEFNYGDTRNVPENVDTYDSVLVLLPKSAKGDDPNPSRIAFVEIKEGAAE